MGLLNDPSGAQENDLGSHHGGRVQQLAEARISVDADQSPVGLPSVLSNLRAFSSRRRDVSPELMAELTARAGSPARAIRSMSSGEHDLAEEDGGSPSGSLPSGGRTRIHRCGMNWSVAEENRVGRWAGSFVSSGGLESELASWRSQKNV